MTEAKLNKRCAGCNASRGSPCPKALERIHAMQASVATNGNNLIITQGCDWYINSAEYGYSFWNLARDLHGSPLSDREICQMLLITQSQLKEIYNGAINKLVQQKDEPYMQEFFELIQELASTRETDNTAYMPDSFRDKIDQAPGGTNEDSSEFSEETEGKGKKRGRKKIKNGLGMPIHRSGDKVDIYFSKPSATKKKK